MGRIDIVVFPGKTREIFGQVKNEPQVETGVLEPLVDSYVQSLANPSVPRKFTGYYEEMDDPLQIEWEAYDENNPIVQVTEEVPIEQPEGEEGLSGPITDTVVVSMELAQVPAEQRAKLDIPGFPA